MGDKHNDLFGDDVMTSKKQDTTAALSSINKDLKTLLEEKPENLAWNKTNRLLKVFLTQIRDGKSEDQIYAECNAEYKLLGFLNDFSRDDFSQNLLLARWFFDVCSQYQRENGSDTYQAGILFRFLRDQYNMPFEWNSFLRLFDTVKGDYDFKPLEKIEDPNEPTTWAKVLGIKT